ncbi:hypothetical protein OIU77_029278 [Salix suchowensis]|uniref:Uncharacterized protein n=1 Tax=Salix suchowensis TaxID=1278906 RepID=A0ABQ9BKB2_9ROSI|nr:hypothetical protein OIU77_029278 [Salix suchowensis]
MGSTSVPQRIQYSPAVFDSLRCDTINRFSYWDGPRERLEEAKALHDGTSNQITAGTDTDSAGPRMKTGRISGWKFNERELELDPEFCIESEDDAVVKIVCVGGETNKNPDIKRA